MRSQPQNPAAWNLNTLIGGLNGCSKEGRGKRRSRTQRIKVAAGRAFSARTNAFAIFDPARPLPEAPPFFQLNLYGGLIFEAPIGIRHPDQTLRILLQLGDFMLVCQFAIRYS